MKLIFLIFSTAFLLICLPDPILSQTIIDHVSDGGFEHGTPIHRLILPLLILVGSVSFLQGQKAEWSFELSAGATLPFSFDSYYVQNSEENRQSISSISGILGFKVIRSKQTAFFLESGVLGLRYEQQDLPPAGLILPGIEHSINKGHIICIPFLIGWHPRIQLRSNSAFHFASSIGVLVSVLGKTQYETFYPDRPDLYEIEERRGIENYSHFLF